MSNEEKQTDRKSGPSSPPVKWWSRQGGDRRRKDFSRLIEELCERIGPETPAARMIRGYADHPRKTRSEERAALHKARVGQDMDALRDLVLSLAPLTLRPLCGTEIYDDHIEDAIHDQILEMMEYLQQMDIANNAQWQTLVSLVLQNGRDRTLTRGRKIVEIEQKRQIKKLTRDVVKSPDIKSLDTGDLTPGHPDASEREIRMVLGAFHQGTLHEYDPPSWDPCALAEQTFDIIALRRIIRNTMSLREAIIFEARYLSVIPWTLAECGQALGVTAERIRQIEREMRARIRDETDIDAFESVSDARLSRRAPPARRLHP